MIAVDLFEFAYVPGWFNYLDSLAEMALPEPWRFLCPSYETQNKETPILERYLNQVFKTQAIEHNYAQNQAETEADCSFHIRNQFACVHTGLYTKH